MMKIALVTWFVGGSLAILAYLSVCACIGWFKEWRSCRKCGAQLKEIKAIVDEVNGVAEKKRR